MTRLRILITVPSLAREFGGPAAKAQQLASALREGGDDVIVLGTGEAPNGRSFGLPVVARFHTTPIPSRIGAIDRLTADADVVHVLGFRDPVGTMAAWAAVRESVPYVLEPVGMHEPRIRSQRLKRVFDEVLGRRVVDRAAVVVATSPLEADELTARGVEPGSIRLRPNGIEVGPLLPLSPRGEFRSSHGVPAEAPLVLALGRITMKKGLPYLAEAVGALGGAWLALVGPQEGDGTIADVRAAARRVGAEERLVIVEAGAWGRDKAAAFADADVFALPSATENFGNAAAEAAALGVPVVVSDRCGVAGWLPASSSAVVPYAEVAPLRDAIVRLLATVVREAARAEAAQVRAALSWPGIAAAQRSMYLEVLGSR
jgi:glycosyltransferase involved in cell wall biosynthesis